MATPGPGWHRHRRRLSLQADRNLNTDHDDDLTVAEARFRLSGPDWPGIAGAELVLTLQLEIDGAARHINQAATDDKFSANAAHRMAVPCTRNTPVESSRIFTGESVGDPRGNGRNPPTSNRGPDESSQD